jgi:hypothetical protein
LGIFIFFIFILLINFKTLNHYFMQKESNASLAFIRETPAEKAPFGQSVIDGLTENATTFPNLPVPLTDLTANNDALTAAVLAAKSGDHIALANLRAVLKVWNANFKRTAKYVSLIANGDESTIRLANLAPTKSETTRRPKPGATAHLATGVNGSKGNFTAACPPVSGATSYVFAAIPEGTSVTYNGNMMLLTSGDKTFYVVVGTRGKADFTNVPSGNELYVSVYAVNSAGCGPATNGQTVIPQ